MRLAVLKILVCLTLAGLPLAAPAFAQAPGAPMPPINAPAVAAPPLASPPLASQPLASQPLASPPLPAPAAPAGAQGPRSAPPALSRGPLSTGVEPGQTALYLSATLSATDAQPLRAGVKWRVYEERAQADGSHKMVAESNEAAPQFVLPNGGYVAHAAYGLAGATRMVRLSGPNVSERVPLNAGGLKIVGMLGDSPAPATRLSLAIYVPERGNAEAKLVLAKGRVGELIPLPEGAYHIVSTLYDVAGGSTQAAPGERIATNSVVTADLRVQAGKLTEATLRHRAATMTLKLVNGPGGEALANTTFTVLTPGGDVIRELIGAFPQLALAEGEYVAIARHQGKTYQSTFKVQSNLDRDVEVPAQDGRDPVTPPPKAE